MPPKQVIPWVKEAPWIVWIIIVNQWFIDFFLLIYIFDVTSAVGAHPLIGIHKLIQSSVNCENGLFAIDIAWTPEIRRFNFWKPRYLSNSRVDRYWYLNALGVVIRAVGSVKLTSDNKVVRTVYAVTFDCWLKLFSEGNIFLLKIPELVITELIELNIFFAYQ